jgi:hypothetical protein
MSDRLKDAPLLEVRNLEKHFALKGGGRIHALNGVSFTQEAVALGALPVGATVGDLALRGAEQPVAKPLAAAVLVAILLLEHLATHRLHDVDARLLGAQSGAGAHPDDGPQAREVTLQEDVDRLRISGRGAAAEFLVVGVHGGHRVTSATRDANSGWLRSGAK